MDAYRLELYELLKPKLDEEAAQKLVLALSPEPSSLATKVDLDARFESFEARMDSRFSQIESRISRMESTLTRRIVTIIGAWTILVASAFSWAAVLLR